MAIEADDNLKIVVTLSMPGLTVSQNVFYARYDSLFPSTEENVTSDLAAWIEEMWLNIEDIIVDVVSISEIVVSKQIVVFPPVFEEIGTEAGTFVGLEIADMVPHGVAMVARIATSGVKSIARKYIAGISEGFSTEAGWTAGAVLDGIAFIVDWITGPPSVDSRQYTGGIVSNKDGLFKTFGVSGILSGIQGYQRRRKPGVGI